MHPAGPTQVVDDFPAPHPVQLQGSALAGVLLRGLGWRVHMHGLPSHQGVVVVYPHTSNWDFFILLLAKWALGLPVKFWGKDSLFALPLVGRWLRWLGGVPVNRSAPQGMVGAMVRNMAQARALDAFFWLALAPEGTRKWTPGWRSGFYRVATAAGVPIGVCSVNYPAKTIELRHFFRPTGQASADMPRIAQALRQAVGKNAAQAAPITILEKP